MRPSVCEERMVQGTSSSKIAGSQESICRRAMDLSYREERSYGSRIVLDLLFAPVVKVRGLYMSHVATTICEEKLLLDVH